MDVGRLKEEEFNNIANKRAKASERGKLHPAVPVKEHCKPLL
jgi:hypothetical protein